MDHGAVTTDDDLPLIVLSVTGVEHLIYAVWCIRSLLAFDYPAIEVTVETDAERRMIASRFPDVPCSTVTVRRDGYPAFSYKPFALTAYLERHGFQNAGRDIVVCDADVLWKRDPRSLFRRFNGKPWVHKITAVRPADYDIAPEHVSRDYISLRTIQNYERRSGMNIYPSYVINAGLFMLPRDTFPKMLERWMSKIHSLPGDEMLMSEALMAVTYAEMDLIPTADACDVKHLGREKEPGGSKPVAAFAAVADRPADAPTGYQTATHYFSDQRAQLVRDAAAMGFDGDHLRKVIARRWRNGLFVRAKALPMRIWAKAAGR